jgi:cell division protein FtsB
MPASEQITMWIKGLKTNTVMKEENSPEKKVEQGNQAFILANLKHPLWQKVALRDIESLRQQLAEAQKQLCKCVCSDAHEKENNLLRAENQSLRRELTNLRPNSLRTKRLENGLRNANGQQILNY